MPLSRNRIKYLNSLRIKKFRDLHGQFLMEGDRIVGDMLRNGRFCIRQLIATGEWLAENQAIISGHTGEVIESDVHAISRISALETPAPVIAVLDIPRTQPDMQEISRSWALVLENIQDPGNLGTIIRTADWFGIRHIICSNDSTDCFNPKAAQASMGALLNLGIHYADLSGFLKKLPDHSGYKVYGTFMTGIPVFEVPATSGGLIVFGNEARGISQELRPFIREHITIPAMRRNGTHVESLNVASTVAIVCAWLVRN